MMLSIFICCYPALQEMYLDPKVVLFFSLRNSVSRALDFVTRRLQVKIRDLVGPRGTNFMFSSQYVVPVFRNRHKTEAKSQSPNGAGSLN